MIDHEQHVRQLASLIADIDTEPTAPRRLADAALIYGLIESNRLDAVVIYIAARIDELDADALGELQDAIKRYTGKPTPAPAGDSPTRNTDTPHVGVLWPVCPVCQHDGRDKTFTGTNGRHTLSDGSPGVYAKCRSCSAAVVIEHWSA